MEESHIIIQDLHNGYFHLTAEEGYQLFSLALQRVVSEAVVKEENIAKFTTIKK